MQIPSTFMLFGHRWHVEWAEDLIEEDNAMGQSRYRKHVIVLQKNNACYKRPSTEAEHTFVHELVHCIFHVMGEAELRENEKLVDVFAGLLHQALTTMEYDADVEPISEAMRRYRDGA